MRVVLTVLVLLTIAFAGCASKGGDGEGAANGTGTSTATGSGSKSGSHSGTATGTSSATSTTASASANHPPTAGISAAVNATLVLFNLTGADQDGDALAWNLTFGDGQSASGSTLPANATHTYAVGNYTAEVSVSDGNATVTQNVTVQIVAGGSGGGAPLQTASVSWDASFTGCAAEYPAIPPAEPAGNVAYGLVAVTSTTIGHTYTAVISWEEGPLALGADISFYDADGMFVEGNLVSGGPPITATGTVPAGAAFAVFTLCDAVASAEATYSVV